MLKNDSEVLVTDSNLTETDLTDSLTLIHRKLDGGCYLIHPLSVNFWIIQILLSYFPNAK